MTDDIRTDKTDVEEQEKSQKEQELELATEQVLEIIDNRKSFAEDLEDAVNEQLEEVEEKKLDADQVKELIDTRKISDLRSQIEETRPADLIEILEELPTDYMARFFRMLKKDKAAEVFADMEPDAQEALISTFSDVELRNILNEMFYDDTVDLIEEMPASVVQRIIANTSKSDRMVLNELLKYPAESAGGIMNTEYIRLKEDLTVLEAMQTIKKIGINKETIYTCYITDKDRHLIGIVSAKDLLLNEIDEVMRDIMETDIISVPTLMDQEDVAQIMTKYNLMNVPIVDTENRLVGIVTVDDAIEVIQDETEEDFSKMAAITPTETPYLKESPFKIWLHRFPWLALLMVSATFTGIIISSFEAALAKVVVLTAFIPMIMDTGGNSGSQASVTVIRNLSMGEVELKDWFRVIWKEIRTAVLCGLSLGVLAFGKIMLVDHMIMNNPSVTVTVAMVVSATLAITIVVAKIIGSMLPLLAERIGLDPAVVASPFITTIVDAISLLVYFAIANALIPGLS